MIAIDTRDFWIPSDENDYDELVAFADTIAGIQTHEVIPIDVLDKIRAEICGIAINGQVDEHTSFIRTGEQVKQMALNIIDRAIKEGDES